MAGSLACLSEVGSLVGDVPDDEIGQLARLLCEWIGAVNRRKLLKLLRGTAGIVVAPAVVGGLNFDEQERLVKAIASPSRVDEQVVDHLAGMLQYCKRQNDRLGPRAVLSTVLAQRSLVDDLLAECPAALRPRLLSVYSDMSTSVAFYFFDLNEFDSAWHYGDQARTAAQDAGNTDLNIHALGSMSYFASWQGKGDTAIDLAAAAKNLVGKTEDPLARVCTAERAGTAYAADGQYDRCMANFELALTGLASAGNRSHESSAYFYNEGFLASKKSDGLLRLGKPKEAATSASDGLTLFDKSFVSSLAFCRLRLGNAHLQSGEIDEAARVVGDAALLTAQTRSGRLTKELRTTRARMQPWRNTRAVKELDGQLASYGLVTSSAT